MLASKIVLTSSFFSCTSLLIIELVRLLRLIGPLFSEAAMAENGPGVAFSEFSEARLAVGASSLPEVLAYMVLSMDAL